MKENIKDAHIIYFYFTFYRKEMNIFQYNAIYGILYKT